MEKKITISEIIYFLYFGVMFGARAAGLYEGMMLYNISLVAGMLLFAVKVLATEHTFFEYLIMALLLGMCLLVYHNTGEKGFLLYMTMMLGMKGVSLKRIEKWALFIMGVCFTITVLLAVTGIKQDIAYPADGRFFFGAVMRRCLGYPYFNTMFTTYIILLVLIMLVAELKTRREVLVTSLFLYAFAIYFYIYTCSNTGLIVATFYLVLNFIMNDDKPLNKLSKPVIMLIYPACMLISIIGPVLITGKAFDILDTVFHNRFNYARYYLQNEPISLFGVRFAPGLNDNYIVDSSFLYSFLQLGVIPCVILTSLMLGMIYCLIKEDRKRELAVVISFCLLGMSDPFFFNLSYKNLMFLFLGELFFIWIRELQDRLPEFWNRSICILRVGKNQIDIPDVVNKCMTETRRFFERVIGKNGFKHFLIFVVTGIILFVLSGLFMDMSIIAGTVDMPDEWELVRSMLSVAIWGAGLIILLINYFERKSTSE